MGYGWEGELVRLVPLDIDRHLDNATRWINDPRVTDWLLVGDFPLTRMAEREWMETASRGAGKDVNFAIETLDGIHLGFSGVHGIDYRHGVASTGSLIGETDRWNQGFGTDAARTRARYCFDVLGLRLLLSEYLDGNEGSRRMQEKTGYRECGRIPKRFWKRGAHRDAVLTYLDRDSWAASGG